MTIPIRDAIKILKTELETRSNGYYDYLANGGKGDCEEEAGLSAHQLAIEALEKQIPKKPTLHHFYENETDYSYHRCANRCHEYCQVNPQDSFCRKCGQAIDWSDAK